MTDPTPEELDALVAELAFLCSPVAEHMSDGRRITAFCKEAGSAADAITALRAREAMIEAAAIERAAEVSEAVGYLSHEDLRALTTPSARTLLDQRIAEAEQAGYERGVREASKATPSKADLPPCQFCGGEAFLDTGFGPCARVVCHGCGVMTPWHTGADCEQAARAAWSRRAPAMGGAQ